MKGGLKDCTRARVEKIAEHNVLFVRSLFAKDSRLSALRDGVSPIIAITSRKVLHSCHIAHNLSRTTNYG